VVPADGAEIRADDDEVDVGEILRRLQLDDDLVGDEEVESMEADLEAAIQNGNGELPPKRMPRPRSSTTRAFS
jgi:hypothetical protein